MADVKDEKSISPDGLYSVCLVDREREAHFLIKNQETNGDLASINMPTRLLFLKWSSDSKSFLTVEHIAGGSYVRIVSLINGEWRSSEIEPKNEGFTDYSVTKIREKGGIALVEFIVTLETKEGLPSAYKLCTIEASLATGEILGSTCLDVKQAEALLYLKKRPDY